MSYTDEQMVIASQLAAFDWDQDAALEGSYTVEELLHQAMESGDQATRSSAEALWKRIMNSRTAQDCANWILKDVRNDQSTSGMYGCMFETTDRQAFIAFRSSEDMSKFDNLMKDWIISDLGLLNNILTPQQATAERYMKDIYRKYGHIYDSYSLTGHSLGGNLAEHAAITAPDGMKERIEQSVNLDGPGFSRRYLDAHASDIEEIKDRLAHNQWSWCGGLLNPVPGSHYRTIEATTPDKGLIEAALWRHDTNSIKQENYDENGNFKPGEPDWLVSIMSPFAKTLDFSLYTLFSIPMVSVAYDTYDKIRDGIGELWEKWQEARYYGQDAEFGIRFAQLNGSLNQISGIEKELQNIGDEVEQIQRNLAYYSIGAGYMRVKLWTIANGISGDGRKAAEFYEKGCECRNAYREYERSIVAE